MKNRWKEGRKEGMEKQGIMYDWAETAAIVNARVTTKTTLN